MRFVITNHSAKSRQCLEDMAAQYKGLVLLIETYLDYKISTADFFWKFSVHEAGIAAALRKYASQFRDDPSGKLAQESNGHLLKIKEGDAAEG